jgi:hypothetical protein
MKLLLNFLIYICLLPLLPRPGSIVLIPKVRPPCSFDDLRPISVTPILSRVFEKLFVRFFFYPSLPKSLLCDQFAFRPTGSTTAASEQLFHNDSAMLHSN